MLRTKVERHRNFEGTLSERKSQIIPLFQNVFEEIKSIAVYKSRKWFHFENVNRCDSL